MIRLLGYLFAIGAVAFFAAAGVGAVYLDNLTKELPNYEVLSKYEPPVTTRIHAADGELMAEYAHEHRLYIPIQAVPDMVEGSLHLGRGQEFLRASGRRLRRRPSRRDNRSSPDRAPASARSAPRRSPSRSPRTSCCRRSRPTPRKIKEAILAFRIEQAYSKDHILELYLNEIYFGLGAYGIADAALTYFDKSVNELTVAEAAYLAALAQGADQLSSLRAIPIARSSAATG